MKISDEQKMTIIGLSIAILIGGSIYLYRHFLVPTKPEEVLAKPTSRQIVVQVSGAVAKEGVYRLGTGARVVEAIKLAGGLLAGADISSLNLAELLKDGQKILIAKQEYPDNSESGIKGSRDKRSRGKANQKINLNTASDEELDELPGVGPATAKKIIEARPFQKPEDLLKIPRFGKSRYEKLKDRICL